MAKPTDLLQGTLDLLILKTLALEPMHGWGIAQRLRQISNDVLQVQEGSLYPALHPLEQQGLIAAKWRPSENNRRAKYYELTRAGRKRLEREASSWQRLSTAIAQVLESAYGASPCEPPRARRPGSNGLARGPPAGEPLSTRSQRTRDKALTSERHGISWAILRGSLWQNLWRKEKRFAVVGGTPDEFARRVGARPELTTVQAAENSP